LNADNDIVTSVCTSANGKAIIRECSMEATKEIQTNLTDVDNKNGKMEIAFMEGNDAFLVYSNPFAIYFITN